MTTPVELPLYGRVHLRLTTKPALIELWADVLGRGGLAPELGVAVTGIAEQSGCLVATTTAGPIRARRILLATGRRGRPRRLGVEGEELPHVEHQLADPTEHADQRILVVGGGDVAVEAALALAEHGPSALTLCHRGARFDRAKPELAARLAAAQQSGALEILLDTTIERFDPESARVVTRGVARDVPADRVFVLVGYDLPTELLASSGVRVQTHFGNRAVVG
jgi:thioredoxin reductase